MSTTTGAVYERPEELLQTLIRFDTTNPPGNEAECVNYIDELLTRAGFETTCLAKEPNRPNLITRLKGQGKAPPLLLYGHVDVVTIANQDWTHPPLIFLVMLLNYLEILLKPPRWHPQQQQWSQ